MYGVCATIFVLFESRSPVHDETVTLNGKRKISGLRYN